MTAGAGGWIIEERSGSAHELHALAVPHPPQRRLWFCSVNRAALVLGSTQRLEVIDTAALASEGVGVVRRHSGGGAVLLVPGEVTWVDVVIPSTDPLWEPDVGAAFAWVGQWWRHALGALAATDAGADADADADADATADADGVELVVHRRPGAPNRWSGLVCFAGLGCGEVTAGPHKLVGLSQRRTRPMARFQCLVHHRFRPTAVARSFALPEAEQAALAAYLETVVGTVSASPNTIREALLAALPG